MVELLRKPMTGMEFLVALHRRGFVKMRLHDITFLLREFEARGLMYCLTPDEITARLYYFTERGRRIVRRALRICPPPLPRRVNWIHYANLLRAPVRKRVLLAMEQPWKGRSSAKTTTMLRKLVNERHRPGLGATIRAVHELHRLNLIRYAGVTEKKQSPLYVLTPAGKRLIEQLKRWDKQSEPSELRATPSNALPSNLFNALDLASA